MNVRDVLPASRRQIRALSAGKMPAARRGLWGAGTVSPLRCRRFSFPEDEPISFAGIGLEEV